MAAMEKTLDRFTVFFGVKVDTRQLRKLETGLQRVQGALNRISKVSIGAATALGGMGVGVVKFAADIEAAQARVANSTNTTTDNIRSFAKDIDSIAKTTGLDRIDLYGGLEKAISGGQNLTRQDHLELLRAGAKAQAAGWGDAGVLISSATTAMQLLGVTADEAFNIAGAAATRTDADFRTFIENTKGIQASAAGSGLSFANAAAEYATLAGLLKSPETGVDAFNAIYAQIANPSKKMRDTLQKQFGLSADAIQGMIGEEGRILPFLRFLKDAGIDTQAELAKMGFTGEQAGRGLQLLIGSLDVLEGNYEAVNKEAEKGTLLNEHMERIAKTLTHQLRSLKQQVMGIAIRIGNRLIPVVRDWAEGMSRVLDYVLDGEYSLEGLNDRAIETAEGMKRLIDSAVGAARAIGIIGRGEGLTDLLAKIIGTVPQLIKLAIRAKIASVLIGAGISLHRWGRKPLGGATGGGSAMQNLGGAAIAGASARSLLSAGGAAQPGLGLENVDAGAPGKGGKKGSWLARGWRATKGGAGAAWKWGSKGKGAGAVKWGARGLGAVSGVGAVLMTLLTVADLFGLGFKLWGGKKKSVEKAGEGLEDAAADEGDAASMADQLLDGIEANLDDDTRRILKNIEDELGGTLEVAGNVGIIESGNPMLRAIEQGFRDQMQALPDPASVSPEEFKRLLEERNAIVDEYMAPWREMYKEARTAVTATTKEQAVERDGDGEDGAADAPPPGSVADPDLPPDDRVFNFAPAAPSPVISDLAPRMRVLSTMQRGGVTVQVTSPITVNAKTDADPAEIAREVSDQAQPMVEAAVNDALDFRFADAHEDIENRSR